MKITFVNHSSFIVEFKDKKIICDPWIEGSVFNNGWKLYSPTLFKYDDFKDIDYIWFSHEHPDHFYPPNVKKIAPEHRKNIKVLFQDTIDKRVKTFCDKLGFNEVIELKKNTYFEILPNFKLLCEHFQEGDSWIHFKTPEMSILNTNDCGILNKHDAKKILKKTGEIDVLMSQFSYAYWAGNPEDIEYRQSVAKEKLNGLKFQCDQFNPKTIIPIASFIYFCHEENKYLNDSINTINKTYNYLEKNVDADPVVLYNGESYTFPEPHNSEPSIVNYNQKLFHALNDESTFQKNNPVEITKLIATADQFIEDLRTSNSWWVKILLKPTTIQLFDTGDIYIMSLQGFKKTLDSEKIDVILSSEGLLVCLKFPYGLDSIQISGRLRKPKQGNYSAFYNLFRINHLKMRGINPNSISYLLVSIFRKGLIKIGFLKN